MIELRPLASQAERDEFARIHLEAFRPGLPVEQTSKAWQQRITTAKEFRPHQWRAAFVDGELAGGYGMLERRIQLGDEYVSTGCIYSVMTDERHRRKGVARALMADALAFAVERRHGILLLHGIGSFYGQFGYVDVFDATEHFVDWRPLLQLAATGYEIRRAMPEDAAPLLDLYLRHHAHRPGSFERDLDRERHRLDWLVPEGRPWIALDRQGIPRGYAQIGPERRRATEGVADDWPALLALLQHHARLLHGTADPPREIIWRLPPGSATYELLADNLTVESRRLAEPDAGWMARIAHRPALHLPSSADTVEDGALLQQLCGFRAGPFAGPPIWIAASDSF